MAVVQTQFAGRVTLLRDRVERFDVYPFCLPVVRTLAIDYTHDSSIYDPAYQNKYSFGPAFLVVPVESNQAFIQRYLPHGGWYNLYTGEAEAGGAHH